MRTKYDANVKLSDRELFEALPLKDIWADADLTSVFEYLYNHKKTDIPDSWVHTMSNFRRELMDATTSGPALVDEYNRLVSPNM